MLNYSILGIVLTLAIFVLGLAFRTGHAAARIEELERWRNSIRGDMHEISDKLEKLANEIARLAVVMEERTERRSEKRVV